jgi:hypothetical protein
MSRRDVDEAAGMLSLLHTDISKPAALIPRIKLTAINPIVLKLYGIASLDPQVWEDVDHEKEGPLAGTMTGEDGSMAEEMDPLGLRGRLSG